MNGNNFRVFLFKARNIIKPVADIEMGSPVKTIPADLVPLVKDIRKSVQKGLFR